MITIESAFLQKVYSSISEKKEALCEVDEDRKLHILQGQVQGLKEAVEIFSQAIEEFDSN